MSETCNTPAVKWDKEKVDFSLIPAEPLTELAKAYMVGLKYDRDNWRKGMEWSRVFAAAQRHLWAWWNGETYDTVDGHHHLAAAAWCCFTLMWYQLKNVGKDNRWLSMSTSK